jgi:cytidine deaminase
LALATKPRLTKEEDALRRAVFLAVSFAQAEISKVRVGAAVLAINGMGERSIFTGCNIEISFSRVFHAENVALLKAISAGYTKIRAVAVTSASKEKQKAAMCGCCRQDYMYLNPNCMVYIFDSDKSLRLKVKLIDSMAYPYAPKGKIV